MAYLAKEMTALQATEIRLGFVFRKNAEEEECATAAEAASAKVIIEIFDTYHLSPSSSNYCRWAALSLAFSLSPTDFPRKTRKRADLNNIFPVSAPQSPVPQCLEISRPQSMLS